MPTYGEWQDGREHEVILYPDRGSMPGNIGIHWEAISEGPTPDPGWAITGSGAGSSLRLSTAHTGGSNELEGATLPNIAPSLCAFNHLIGGSNQTVVYSDSDGCDLRPNDPEPGSVNQGQFGDIGAIGIRHTGAIQPMAPPNSAFDEQIDGWQMNYRTYQVAYESDEYLYYEAAPAELPPGAVGVEAEDTMTRTITEMFVMPWNLHLINDARWRAYAKQPLDTSVEWPDLSLDWFGEYGTVLNMQGFPLVGNMGDAAAGLQLSVEAAQAVQDDIDDGNAMDFRDPRVPYVGFAFVGDYPGWAGEDEGTSEGVPYLDWGIRLKFRTARYRFIYDSTAQPPQRVFPREDGLIGPGARRNYPPPRSRQRSPRTFGGYL